MRAPHSTGKRNEMNASHEVLILNFLVEEKTPGAVPVDPFFGRALRALRTQLGMEAAFISRYGRDGHALLVHADSCDDALRPGCWDTYAWQDEAPAPEPGDEPIVNSTHMWMSAGERASMERSAGGRTKRAWVWVVVMVSSMRRYSMCNLQWGTGATIPFYQLERLAS